MFFGVFCVWSLQLSPAPAESHYSLCSLILKVLYDLRICCRQFAIAVALKLLAGTVAVSLSTVSGSKTSENRAAECRCPTTWCAASIISQRVQPTSLLTLLLGNRPCSLMRISTWFLIPIQSLMLAEGTLLNCRLTTQLEVRFMLHFKCSDDSPCWGASSIVASKFPIHLCYLGIRWLCQTRHSCVQWCIHGHIHPDCMQESMQNEKGGSKVAKKSHIYIDLK